MQVILDGKDVILREIEIVEHHIHRRARTYGKSADQSGNNWAAEDRLIPFRCISGNNNYGADLNDEAKIFGSDDTPFLPNHMYFDIWGFFVIGVSHASEYILRFIWGNGLSMADAILAGQYSTKIVKFDTFPAATAYFTFEIGIPRLFVGIRCWCQCKNVTDDAWVDFYVTGCHGYPGRT